MKNKSFKRLFALLTIGFGAIALSACQTTNKTDAEVIIKDESRGSIVEVIDEGKITQYVSATVGLKNNTIYNVTAWNMVFEIQDGNLIPFEVTIKEDVLVLHGQSGFANIVEKLETHVDPNSTTIRIKSGTPAEFQSLWQSYSAWWIVGIVIASLSTIFFAMTLFGSHLTKKEAIAVLRKHIASEGIFLGFILLICLFPLFFGSWVSMLILLGGFAVSLILCGLLTWIKYMTGKDTLPPPAEEPIDNQEDINE